MRLGSRAISSTLRIKALGGFDLLLVDGGWLVVHLRPVDLRLGVRLCPNCRVARQHAVVQVLLDGAPLDGNVRLGRGKSLETALALRPELRMPPGEQAVCVVGPLATSAALLAACAFAFST